MSADVIALGRVGIDLYSTDYNVPLKEVRHFAKYVGGGAANLAVGLARLGVAVDVVSGVRDDELGNFITDFLRSENVGTNNIIRSASGRTGIVFAEVIPGKESHFIFYRENAADLMISMENVDNAGIPDSKIVVTTGTGLSAEPSRSATLYAMELAKKNRKQVIFNLDWRPSLWSDSDDSLRMEAYSKGIDLASVVVGNEIEFMAATGAATADVAIARIPSKAAKLLILTRGEKGNRAYLPEGKIVDIPAFRVEVLKTLGAGDGNLAGIVFGLLNGWEIRKAMRLGAAIGAIVVTKHSCSDAMPRYEAVMDFIEKSGGF
jgi:5-dehydro-2-deoxygluconokinase